MIVIVSLLLISDFFIIKTVCAFFLCRCHMCMDLAWNCHATFKDAFAEYNELPEIGSALCRQFIAKGCEKDVKCCTGIR